MLLILLPNSATTEIQGSCHSAFRIMLKKIAHDWRSCEPRRIIAALKRYASHRLEHLYISGACVNVDADLDDKQDCSLRAFEKLRHIHVAHYLFCSVADKLNKLDYELSDSRTP